MFLSKPTDDCRSGNVMSYEWKTDESERNFVQPKKATEQRVPTVKVKRPKYFSIGQTRLSTAWSMMMMIVVIMMTKVDAYS
jgi:hypothetical protein